MGVKYSRDYKEIVKELKEAIQMINNYYEFFGMNLSDWEALSLDEKNEYTLTLADDIFYALGNVESLTVGDGTIKYKKDTNVISIFYNDSLVNIVL